MIALLFAAVTAIILSNSARRAVPAAAMEPCAPTLVIDPGHGGLDGGAVTADGTTESSINLAIALRLRDLCRVFGVSCLMTRSTQELPYPPETESIRAKKVWDQQQRAELLARQQNPVFLSIHQNFYPDPRPSGTQVLYGAAEGSQDFGVIAHDNLLRWLCPDSRRVPVQASDSIFLMKQASCPAVLVECGFLSNPAEAQKLATGDYQTRVAAILLASYRQFIPPSGDSQKQ